MNYPASFALHLRRRGKSPATVKNYGRALAGFKDYCGRAGKRGSMRQNLQPRQLEGFRDYLLKTRGLRPSTVNGRLTALSAFARFLLERGLLAGNPLELVARVGRDGTCQTKPRASGEEVRQLRREVNRDVLDLPGRLIVELLYTGLTVAELCSLRWNGEPAGDSLQVGSRRIILHPEAQLALKHYLILRPILMGDYLIVGQGAGWSLQPGTVYALLKRLSAKIKARVSVSDLRLAQFAQATAGIPKAPAAQPDIAA